jgi:ATP-dependent DNA helicase RecG
MITENTEVTKILKLTQTQKKGFEKLNIKTIFDLLTYYPVRYTNMESTNLLINLNDGDETSLFGILKSIELKKGFTTKKYQVSATVENINGETVNLIWFNQHYISKMYKLGDNVKISGKIKISNKRKVFINPEIEHIKDIPININNSSLFKEERLKGEEKTYFPIYKETKGITSKFLYHSIKKIINQGIHAEIKDDVPKDILEKYNLPKKSTALFWIHLPKTEKHEKAARKRFAFEEIFKLQLIAQYEKKILSKEKSYQIDFSFEKLKPFLKNFKFGATNAQEKAVSQILKDMSCNHPMSRLLEGDVGSGKTFVAACATYATIMTRPKNQNFGTLQVAYMTPTEILANQQYESFIEYFKDSNIQIGLITSSGCKKFPSKLDKNGSTKISKSQLAKWISNGEINIVVGTHSLIQKTINFKHLALVIIDEQHRFGMKQRASLAKKDKFMPHLLSMSATPIPRTLALTIYGGLDITILDELPKGRKKVQTKIILESEREKMYDHIKNEIKSGRQAYIICPRIDEIDEDTSNNLYMKSVSEETKKLEKRFREFKIEGLHSKMTKQKKESVMENFLNKKINILVSTSVIEVGVNIPNATVMLIEGAERFGLSQLHQLRGRIQRGSFEPYCFLSTESKTDKTLKRLELFVKAKNGFELAEFDLINRGAGELTGKKQWGIKDIGMEAIKNIKLVEIAQDEAIKIIQKGFIPKIDEFHHFE